MITQVDHIIHKKFMDDDEELIIWEQSLIIRNKIIDNIHFAVNSKIRKIFFSIRNYDKTS